MADLGRWISILYRYGQSYLNKQTEPLGLGKGQLPVLLFLYRYDGSSQQQLTEYLKVDKGCIAKTVKKLEQQGYVTRETDLSDKRAFSVRLTQKAKDAMPAIREAILSWEDVITAGLSDEEKAVAEKIIYNMAKNAYNYKDRT